MYAGRIAAVVAIVIALAAQNTNIAVLGALAVVVVARANVPVGLLLLFWKRLNTCGVVTGILLGIASAVLLILLGPQVMGDNAFYPLTYLALVSVPMGFLGCWLGMVLTSSRVGDYESPYELMQVQAGFGVRFEDSTEVPVVERQTR